MNRLVPYVIGPELVWLLLLAFAGIFVALHPPVTGQLFDLPLFKNS